MRQASLWRRLAPFLAVAALAALCMSCHTTASGGAQPGPILGTVGAIVAAIIGVLDGWLGAGVIDAPSYATMRHGIESLGSMAQQAVDATSALKGSVEAVRAKEWTPTETAGAAGILLTAIAGTIKAAQAGAVRQVRRERGPTETERRAAAKAST